MKLGYNLTRQLNWLLETVYFFKKHFKVIITLGLIAAFGRVWQLGGFGEITSWMHIVLEVVIESARLLMFLYVLGLANIKEGGLRVRRFFTHKDSRKLHLAAALQKLKTQWFAIVLNIIGFLFIAFFLNYLIDLVAYETCLYLSLKSKGILDAGASEWTILLFFKNLSVIPFALIFEAVFLLWLTNKLKTHTQAAL